MIDKLYIVRLKVSLLTKNDNFKEYIYIDYNEVKNVKTDGNFLIEVKDEFDEKHIREIKPKDLNILTKSNSKRSYEMLFKVSSKNQLNELDLRERMYNEIIKSIKSEIEELSRIEFFVDDLKNNVNVLL